MSLETPMISAVCLTHSSRFGLLQRAIINFNSQNYPHKELIIATNEPGHAQRIKSFLREKNYVKHLGGNQELVRLVSTHSRDMKDLVMHTLASAYGEVIAVWDDDNLSHPDRLNQQIQDTAQSGASAYGDSLYYFYDSDELFVVDYSQPAGKSWERCASSSLLFYREAFQGLGGGTTLPWSAQALSAMGDDYDLLYGFPQHFIVGSNGDNMRSVAWHRRQGSQLPAVRTRESLNEKTTQDTLNTVLKAYLWPRKQVTVAGKDAMAYEITGLTAWPKWLAPTNPPTDWEYGIPNDEMRNRKRQESDKRRKAKKAKK
jgi:hypothetical protein